MSDSCRSRLGILRTRAGGVVSFEGIPVRQRRFIFIAVLLLVLAPIAPARGTTEYPDDAPTVSVTEPVMATSSLAVVRDVRAEGVTYTVTHHGARSIRFEVDDAENGCHFVIASLLGREIRHCAN